MSLTTRAMTLICLAFALAIVGAWSTDPTLSQFWKFAAAMILLGLAVEGFLVSRTRISLDVAVPARGYLGRSQRIALVFQNPSRRAVTIEYAPAMPHGITVPEATRRIVAVPGAVSTDPYDIVPTRLGEKTWPVIDARLRGALGLAWWPRKLPVATQFTVGPDLLGDVPDREALAESGAANARARGTGGELLQLREYQPGDPLHRMDWKATARRGALITREYVEDQHLDIVIGLDCGRASRLEAGQLDRLGAFANVAARFAEHAILQDDSIGLVVFAERPQQVIAPSRGQSALIRMRRALEKLTPRPAETSLLEAALRISQVARHRSLVVLFTDLDEAALAGELVRAVRLLQQRHMTIVAGVVSEEVAALEHRMSTGWLDPYISLAASEAQSRRRSNLAALRARGAHVIATRHQELEKAVMQAYMRLRRERRI
jgi:uncharacterized protein (DUF58 family)